MLDQAKVPGDTSQVSDHQLQRRVAKFFGLACANSVAKGCVNLGVMQVAPCCPTTHTSTHTLLTMHTLYLTLRVSSETRNARRMDKTRRDHRRIEKM